MIRRLLALIGALVVSTAVQLSAQAPKTGFDHPKHAKLFPRCETCHTGAADPSQSIWPTVPSCAQCHDGTVQPLVAWQPRTGPVPGNLRFEHGRHGTAAARAAKPGADPPTCASCHQPTGQGRMDIRRTISGQCLDCHQPRTAHFSADTACATCHLPLSQATSLSAERVKQFAVPVSHKEPGFLTGGPTGHGGLAKPTGRAIGVAASCATCHARDFCVTCHVNAPEVKPIAALAPDLRSLVHKAELIPPASHRLGDFERTHGKLPSSKGQPCATCHTRESCLACHAGTVPRVISTLAMAGPGRGKGAQLTRRRPLSHTFEFKEQHAAPATAAARSCAACHARTQCLDCHRPDPGRGSGYHPTGFLTRHPSASYARETSCADCHNQQQFCVTCHVQAGMTARAALGTANFHDAKRFFLFGHGQAARQSLESCVSCHAERDCLTCHASQGGRRFNPHGPGFDPNRLRRKNPEMCTACHGLAIPTR